MLKQILQQKIKEKEHSEQTVIESTDNVISDIDPEVELILPMVADGEHEYDNYRFMLKQLKKRSPKAFQKIVNLD